MIAVKKIKKELSGVRRLAPELRELTDECLTAVCQAVVRRLNTAVRLLLTSDNSFHSIPCKVWNESQAVISATSVSFWACCHRTHFQGVPS